MAKPVGHALGHWPLALGRLPVGSLEVGCWPLAHASRQMEAFTLGA